MIDLIPPKIIEAFSERAELPLRDLAKAMGRDIKTLQKQREAGNLPVHIKGTGTVRRHYVCTLRDVAEFYRRTGEECPSTSSRIHRTIITSSRSKVIAFTGQRKPAMNVRLRKSRKRSELKPSG